MLNEQHGIYMSSLRFFFIFVIAVLSLNGPGCSNMLDYYAGDWGLGNYTRPDSLVINNNAQFAYSVEVELKIFSETAVQMRIRNDGDVWADSEDGWVDYDTAYTWTLDYGNGIRTVYLEFRGTGDEVSQVQDDIVFIDRINASDGITGAGYGCAVAMSGNGNRVVAGAQNRGEGEETDGAAYVYDWNGSGWDESRLTSDSIPGSDGFFGSSVAISGNGSYIAVGAEKYNSGYVLDSGTVFTFRWNGSAWEMFSQLTASPPGSSLIAHGFFGNSAALSYNGTTLLVGAYTPDDVGNAYIYTLSGSIWSGVELDCPNQGDADRAFYGYSVSLSGDGTIAAVGAPYQDNGSYNDQGCVYLFTYSGTWQQAGTLTTAEPEAYALFGSSLSLSNDGQFLAVGAREYTGDGEIGQGAVFIYENEGSSWSALPDMITADDGEGGDHFGVSVSLSDEYDGIRSLAVGANEHDVLYDNQGAVYIFELDNGTGHWEQKGKVIPDDASSGDYFGCSVSMSGDNGLRYGAGAMRDYVNGIQQGSCYIFDND